MSNTIGKCEIRVDAFDKAAGRAKFTDDLCDSSALVTHLVHATVAHGLVKSIDTGAAERVPGVVKVFTCFDVPENYFPTAGHPWSTDPGHQDVADRLLLSRHVRYYGEDIAVVVAEDPVAAAQAARLVRVEYEELPFVLDVQKALEPGAPQLHEAYPGNLVDHTRLCLGDYDAAIQEPGLIKVEGWYDTPMVQHCHLENNICTAYMENGRIVVTASTQIPHIIRRICAQALGVPWGRVRIIKPYIGGGFGNKQDALYEPLCAWLTTQLGGRLVKVDCAREDTFVTNRVRHAIRSHLITWVRPDGSLAARKAEYFSNQGAYISHGHGVVAKGMSALPELYPCPNIQGDAYTAFTNRPSGGAMRGYGTPQVMWAEEGHIDEIAQALGRDPVEYRRQIVMPQGFRDPFSKNENYCDSFRQVMDKGMEAMDYQRKRVAYRDQTGPVRRGVGMALFWYNTGVWPISLESRAATPPLPRWPPTPSASPSATSISSPPRIRTSPPTAPARTPPARPIWAASP